VALTESRLVVSLVKRVSNTGKRRHLPKVTWNKHKDRHLKDSAKQACACRRDTDSVLLGYDLKLLKTRSFETSGTTPGDTFHKTQILDYTAVRIFKTRRSDMLHVITFLVPRNKAAIVLFPQQGHRRQPGHIPRFSHISYTRGITPTCSLFTPSHPKHTKQKQPTEYAPRPDRKSMGNVRTVS
jgi:hypothetical protein